MVSNIVIELAISFIGSIPALIFALWIDKQRMPKLKIIASEDTNSDVTCAHPNAHAGERWKFFRVAVKNEPFRWPFQWIPRQTAENCRSKIEFTKIESENKEFSMSGRWSSSPELPYMSGNDAVLKALYPDPVSIPINEEEILDIAVQCQSDNNAYAWNNEAYFSNWRPQNHKLEKGRYSVKITIATQNGVTFTQKFELSIADSIDNTYLKSSAT